jgi:hypothetical protein
MSRLSLFLVLFLAIVPGASDAGVRISNLRDLTVPTKYDGTQFSLEEVRAAIIEGCTARGWSAALKSEGMISASILVRGKHLAQITIPFNSSTYSLLYESSENLDYSASRLTIHRNYNKWVLKLSRTINQKFGAGLEASQASALEAKASASSRRDDVYRKLLQLGELRDKGIITEEEFEAEKRKLMEQD